MALPEIVSPCIALYRKDDCIAHFRLPAMLKNMLASSEVIGDIDNYTVVNKNGAKLKGTSFVILSHDDALTWAYA